MKESLTWDRFEDTVIFRFHGVIQSDITGELRHKILRTLKEERVDTAIFHLGDAAHSGVVMNCVPICTP